MICCLPGGGGGGGEREVGRMRLTYEDDGDFGSHGCDRVSGENGVQVWKVW